MKITIGYNGLKYVADYQGKRYFADSPEELRRELMTARLANLGALAVITVFMLLVVFFG